jgi:thioredoxin
MATYKLNAENLPSLLKRGIVFVDWWAPWCGPCRIFGPVFDKVAEQNPEVVFAKINADEDPELALSFGIQSIPTLMIFRDGILVFAQTGVMPEEALQALAGRVKELDMDVVRAKLAAHAQAKMSN